MEAAVHLRVLRLRQHQQVQHPEARAREARGAGNARLQLFHLLQDGNTCQTDNLVFTNKLLNALTLFKISNNSKSC